MILTLLYPMEGHCGRFSFRISERGCQHLSIHEFYRQNPRKSHGKVFAYSVDSAGSDKLNNFVGQIQNYDYLIVGFPLP